MTAHNLFYYPYASFTNAQLPLLKVAALYFDKLVLLDPIGASWDTVGADQTARNGLKLLKDAGILELVTPAAVLAKHEESIAAAIRRDMADHDFLALCDAQAQLSGRQRWTISLAKVPQDLRSDQAMRHLMGDFAREVARNSGEYQEQTGTDPSVFYEYAETGTVYDEYRESDAGDVEYRMSSFPLSLGEAIMMNHALFAGLLHSDATPITDDPFHYRALAHKLQRATQEPVIRQAIADRFARRQLKAGALAATALTDAQIQLPILNPAIPLAEVLEYRQRHPEALARVRDTLGLMAQRIQAEPWSADFEHEIETRTLPDLIEQLREATKSRDEWLSTQRNKQWLKAAGIAVGAASAVLAVVAAPVTPVVLAAAGLTLASGTAIPGAEWLLDWRDGKKSVQENGLHYLLTT
ncbi:hypothetical protein [Sinorhizobium meliloti]|uniref:hypothetical protein n=1 Tax=Rhizobium meliloti TaxID=382 RepID=UPI000FDC606D|nr:hypothetical protein [Sinorhizobium meliloti]RVM04161.1 hypothetical protein CN134_32145 [Sinorhizobium meliloti]RVO21842.1 hypothetical protein CN098_32575 [Sinorhizobium meliloti]